MFKIKHVYSRVSGECGSSFSNGSSSSSLRHIPRKVPRKVPRSNDINKSKEKTEIEELKLALDKANLDKELAIENLKMLIEKPLQFEMKESLNKTGCFVNKF
jgi:hypothetical protein